MSVMVKVTNADPMSHCEVYVKDKIWPTLNNFTIHNVSAYTGQDSYTIITMPGFTDWKIGIYGERRCAYSMVIFVEPDADCHCSTHGKCVRGNCVCDPGYSGQKCEDTDVVLQSNITILGSVGKEEWKFYVFHAFNCTQMAFILKEQATVGHLGLYISVGQPPTLTSYLVKEDNTAKNYHRVALLFQVPPTKDFPINVAVRGSSYIVNGEQLTYKIVGFQTPF